MLIELRHFVFHDNTDRFSIDDKEKVTNFLNFHSVTDGFRQNVPKETLITFTVTLNEMRSVQKREVYNMLDLLGDLGGVATSIMTLGRIAHVLLVG